MNFEFAIIILNIEFKILMQKLALLAKLAVQNEDVKAQNRKLSQWLNALQRPTTGAKPSKKTEPETNFDASIRQVQTLMAEYNERAENDRAAARPPQKLMLDQMQALMHAIHLKKVTTKQGQK